MAVAPAAVEPAVGRLPDPRLPQDLGAEPRRAGGHALQVPDGARGAHSRGLVRQAGGASPTAPTATSTRSPTASPTSAPGPSCPTGPTGWPTTSTGRSARAAIEDSLSDALHEQLTQRFVDRRTSALMRGLQGEGRAVRRDRRGRRGARREALRRPPAGLPLLSRRRRPRASTARPRAMPPPTCWPRSWRCACAASSRPRPMPSSSTPQRRDPVARRGDRAAGGGRRSAQADRSPCSPTSTSAGARAEKVQERLGAWLDARSSASG